MGFDSATWVFSIVQREEIEGVLNGIKGQNCKKVTRNGTKKEGGGDLFKLL